MKTSMTTVLFSLLIFVDVLSAERDVPGVVCRQTQAGDDEVIHELELARENMEHALALRLRQLMSTEGGTTTLNPVLVGPGNGRAICLGNPYLEARLKSAVTDYGYVRCDGEDRCTNVACGACEMFYPERGECGPVLEPPVGGLPDCGQNPPESVRLLWRTRALLHPRATRGPPRNSAISDDVLERLGVP